MYPGAFAATDPGKAAVVMSDTGATLTYAQLEDRSIRLSRAMHDHGLRPGDTVALLSHNAALVVFEVYWAAMRSGLYLTAINTQLSRSELAYILNDSAAKAIVVGASCAAIADAITDETPRVTLRIVDGADLPGYVDYETVLATASPDPLPEQPRGKDMLYSSGTTGLPKGVRAPLPPYSVEEGSDPLLPLFGPVFGWDADTVYLSPAPLYHTAPLRFSGMIHSVGGTVVVMPKFDAIGALEAIERYRVNQSQWVPTMFVRLLKLPDSDRNRFDLSSLRVAIHVGAPCPVDVKRAMIAWWGPVLVEYYASTEAIGVTLIDSPTWLEKPASVGRALLGVVHICADDGSEVPTGEPGLVFFERDTFPFAYLNDPVKTDQARHPHHSSWATAGDIGYVDRDGFLYLTDRKSFMIISGGVNIYPQEVENALALHPKVEDIAVIGIPDPEMGEQVKGFVIAAPGSIPGPMLESELIEFLRARIAHYKVPRTIEFVKELPRTETGKLQKHKLRAQYVPDALRSGTTGTTP